MNDPLLLRVSEAARLLSVSRGTAYQLVAARAIPTVRIGRSVRIPRKQLEQWISARADVSGPDHAAEVAN